MLGVHLISAGNHEAGTVALMESRSFAEEAEDEAAVLMAQGWVHVSNMLAGRDEARPLGEIEARLKEMGEDGSFYASQFAPALARLRVD